MSRFPDFALDDRWVLSHRSGKLQVDPEKVYASLVESEPDASGQLVDVATLFLTNSECPFHCVMCDLWKNTTDEKTAPGLIPLQIRNALMNLPPARHIKLYNSGNFFDTKAIPTQDYEAIASLLEPFENVIV
ncbi:MAG TPA: hypothetical protein VJ508_11630, partial [Saprospiraceae bacterium]|nr:hypothetical protein [Saprospiraceae bacterium]